MSTPDVGHTWVYIEKRLGTQFTHFAKASLQKHAVSLLWLLCGDYFWIIGLYTCLKCGYFIVHESIKVNFNLPFVLCSYIILICFVCLLSRWRRDGVREGERESQSERERKKLLVAGHSLWWPELGLIWVSSVGGENPTTWTCWGVCYQEAGTIEELGPQARHSEGLWVFRLAS